MKAINTEQLTKFYGKNRGITDVNLSVEEGDFFGFIGPNGAGKSTTIRTLLGLIAPTRGRGQVLGKDIVKSRIEILSQVGYLPSEAVFYNGMRVRDILNYSAKLYKTDCKDEAKKLCERLELDTSRRVDELSLGNRKKVGIVCALQHKPKLYILDEPTSGLDPLMQKEFYELLKERNKEGATVFLSSHVLSEIGRYCKHAAIIRDGEILVSDSVEKLGHTGVKRVTLQGANDIPQIDGIKNVTNEKGSVSFLYSGNPKDLLSQLTNIPFTDFTVTDPDLDEVFMHYYVKEEN
ncbi:MAG: ABC transporter ATP-binding protein [Oscillospiraceae bacterium]|nr:ABC transporter ATP-binding protein [Oscillospiraceae bacterium]